MEKRKAMIREYKENPPPAGIFKITNTANGKILIGKVLNVQGRINSNLAQLKFGSHRNRVLQEEWNQYGPDAFSFEILDFLKEDPANPETLVKELAVLEDLWLDKLKPYDEKGYNREPVKTKDLPKY